MILIFSQHLDESTNDVFDYLRKYTDETVLKLNTDDMLHGHLNIQIGKEYFHLNGTKIHYSDIKAVWFRRWFDYSSLREGIRILERKNKQLSDQLYSLTIQEAKVLFNFFVLMLKDAFWLSKPDDNDINKLFVLHSAKMVGLDIPESSVLTRKKEIPSSVLITKTLGDASNYYMNGEEFTFYTEKIIQEKIATSFFPSLFQHMIKKEFEIRTFFLDDTTYSVAIFSQHNDRTSLDYRHYDEKTPNYYTKFSLPKEVHKKLCELMQNLGLNTGSIDLIKSTDGKYYFLEVNPIGQFGFVSHQGNYFIEKHIAKLLIDEHNAR